MGDAAKEAGIPEGGCEGVSVWWFLLCFFCSHICMVQGKAYRAVSLLVQLVFSKDGGSDGVNSEVRWACYIVINRLSSIFFVPNPTSCQSTESLLILGLGRPYALFGRRGKIFFILEMYLYF